MNTNQRSTHLLAEPEDPSKWESAMQAFLAEKFRRTGSMRTVQSDSRILSALFGQLRKTPDQVVTSEAMAFCFGRSVAGEGAGCSHGEFHSLSPMLDSSDTWRKPSFRPAAFVS